MCEFKNHRAFRYIFLPICRYDVLLADVQVLVVSRNDNWRLLTAKGFSHLHIVDKLSVNFHFERFVFFVVSV